MDDRTELNQGWRLSVAPMLDWSDKHGRFLHRLLTKRTRLYTEMVTTGGLLHGGERRHLRYDEVEHPLALGGGGSTIVATRPGGDPYAGLPPLF